MDQGKNWKCMHKGDHQHSCPPLTGKIDLKTQKELKTLIQNNPEATCTQLKLGTPTRKPISEYHPSLINRDRLKYLKKTILSTNSGKSTLSNILQFAEKVKPGFLRKEDILGKFPHMIFQDQAMEVLLKNMSTCLETDSVEGFISEPNLPQKINVTFTSGFDPTLGKWVPLVISILFGKSEQDYKIHWDYVFSVFESQSSSDFYEKFPGNVCDMSDALRKLFYNSLKEYMESKFHVTPKETDITEMYSFCKVHFDRSKRRVAINKLIVPDEDEETFNNMVDELFEFDRGELTGFIKKCKEFLIKFPKAKNWLLWHLHPDRAVVLFNACKGDPGYKKQLLSNTNAQENIGRQFQYGQSKPYLTFYEGIQYVFSFCNSFNFERESVSIGIPIRYGFFGEEQTRKRKEAKKKIGQKKFENDGRPPDTTLDLVGKKENNRVLLKQMDGLRRYHRKNPKQKHIC